MHIEARRGVREVASLFIVQREIKAEAISVDAGCKEILGISSSSCICGIRDIEV